MSAEVRVPEALSAAQKPSAPQRTTLLGPVILVAVALTAVSSPGCDETDPPHSPPAAPMAPERGARPTAPEAEASPWPEDVTDLGATVERFETTENCTDNLRGRLPAEITDLVTDLGYDTLLDDACESVAAVRAGDLEACDALSVSAVQGGCRVRLAVFHHRPEACPVLTGTAGRDANCVAWASRDPELCRAARGAEGAICRAVFEGEASACDAVRSDLRSRCRARVGRFAAVLGDDRRQVMDEVETHFRLTVRSDDGAGDDVVIDGDDAGRGVILEAEGCTHRLVVGDVGVLRARVPKASVSLSIPAGAALPLRLPLGGTAARLLVALPERGIGDSMPGGTGLITVEALGTHVGGRVVISIDGELDLPPRRVATEGHIETFVRDVEALADGCAAEAPPAPE